MAPGGWAGRLPSGAPPRGLLESTPRFGTRRPPAPPPQPHAQPDATPPPQVQSAGLPGAGRTAGCRRRAPRLARRALLLPRAEGPHTYGLGDGPSTSGRGGHHGHAPSPPAAFPERAGAGGARSNAVPLTTLARSPALRALALSTVALPRRALEQRYGDAAVAVAEPLAAPELLPAPARLAPGAALAPAPGTPGRYGGRPGQQAAERGGAAAADEAPLSREALTLVLLATAVSFICSIDRAAMSVAILPMGEQFGWDDAAKGSVSSAFFAGACAPRAACPLCRGAARRAGAPCLLLARRRRPQAPACPSPAAPPPARSPPALAALARYMVANSN